MMAIKASVTCFFFTAVAPGLATKSSYPDRQCQGTGFPDPLNIRKCLTNAHVCGQVGTGQWLSDGQLTEEDIALTAQKLGECFVKSISEESKWIYDSAQRMPSQGTVGMSMNEIPITFKMTSHFNLCSKFGFNLKRKWSETNFWQNINLLLDLVECLVKREPVFQTPALWKKFLCTAAETVLKTSRLPVSILMRLIFEHSLPCDLATQV